MHVVKRPYIYFHFQPSLGEGVSALDNTSDRNIEHLKRRAENVFNDPEKSEKIEKVCRLLTRRVGPSTQAPGRGFEPEFSGFLPSKKKRHRLACRAV